MQTVLFLSSAPQHSLWYLGLATGPFRNARCALAQTHWREDRHDYLIEAMSSGPQALFAEFKSFPKLVTRLSDRISHGRRVLESITGYAERLQPDYVIVGNDKHPEFYAALRGAPHAVGAYVDDGWGTYRSLDDPFGGLSVAARELKYMLSVWARFLSFGVMTERPALVGGSHRVREAWVMAPEYVNAALSQKILRPMETSWFRDQRVIAACARAVGLSGLDPDLLAKVRLLLVLPHDAFMRRHPELRPALEQLALDHAGSGETVAYKHHPRSRVEGLRLPAERCLEIPNRLPAEILAPLLGDTLVVGVMTSALIFLPRLQPGIRVQAIVPRESISDPITRIYRKVGVDVLEHAKVAT